MPEHGTDSAGPIPQELMLARLLQSEQMREFFIQMWLQNPALAERAGSRVREILSPVRHSAQVPTEGSPGGADFSAMSRGERGITP